MSAERWDGVISVDESSWEEGDLLSESIQVSGANEVITGREFAMCDGEGGSAPSTRIGKTDCSRL